MEWFKQLFGNKCCFCGRHDEELKYLNEYGTYDDWDYCFHENCLRDVLETEDEEYAKMAEAVLDRVIEEQKVTVDATTGATTTSMAFLKAVELALT